eukprot:1158282-Pelagomonas_calceolata.AAC.18
MYTEQTQSCQGRGVVHCKHPSLCAKWEVGASRRNRECCYECIRNKHRGCKGRGVVHCKHTSLCAKWEVGASCKGVSVVKVHAEQTQSCQGRGCHPLHAIQPGYKDTVCHVAGALWGKEVRHIVGACRMWFVVAGQEGWAKSHPSSDWRLFFTSAHFSKADSVCDK